MVASKLQCEPIPNIRSSSLGEAKTKDSSSVAKKDQAHFEKKCGSQLARDARAAKPPRECNIDRAKEGEGTPGD